MERAMYTGIVKLQLTKDKTIEINFPGGGGKKKAAADIVGVELFSNDARGCPAVRLVNRKKVWHLAAASFIPAPDGNLPERWEDTPKQPTWELPKSFLAPHAALAVNSSMCTFSQSTADAVIQDMMHGPIAVQSDKDPGEKKRFGIKRPAATPPETPASAPTGTRKRPEFPTDGVPVSENGRRFVVRPHAEQGFHLAASMPEFQALWLSRLLPEGRRPTASSIQVAESALMASVLCQPGFKAAEGNVLAVFVRPERVYLAGYKKGVPVLWRRCPSVKGSLAMREGVMKTLGVTEDLVDAVLNESLVDPRPALEPFVHPILEQLELSRAYLADKHAMKIDRITLMGISAGAALWKTYTAESLKLEVEVPNVFDGLVVDKGVEIADAQAFLPALGAAIAGAEVEL